MGGEGGVVTLRFSQGNERGGAATCPLLNHNSLDNCLLGVLDAFFPLISVGQT